MGGEKFQSEVAFFALTRIRTMRRVILRLWARAVSAATAITPVYFREDTCILFDLRTKKIGALIWCPNMVAFWSFSGLYTVRETNHKFSWRHFPIYEVAFWSI